MSVLSTNRPALKLRPGGIFLLILLLALTLRLALNLTHEGFLGVDGGAYLLSRNAVLGDEPTGAGFPRPPLAPGWLLVPFTSIWGDDNGYKIWAAAFSLLPLIPIYLLTRRYAGEWPAVAAAGIAAMDWYHAEMMVTGALPLAGFALLGLAWWAMGELSTETKRFSWRNGAILALSIGLIPWVNQTSAGLAVILLPVFYLSLLVFSDRRLYFIRNTWPSVFLGGAIALGALPWYMQVLPGSDILAFDGPIWYPYPVWDFSWYQMAFTLPVGVWAVWRLQDGRLRALGVLVVVMALLLPWQSYDETIMNIPYRSRYLMAVPFYVLAAWIVFNRWIPYILEELRKPGLAWRQGFIALALTTVLGVWAWGYQSQFYTQAFYADMATPETTKALDWLRQSDPRAGVATNSFTLSLWVSALNQVHSPFAFTAPPPRAYVEDYGNLRCLYGWVKGCNPMAAQAQLGVNYLLVDQRFPDWGEGHITHPPNYLAPPDQWERTAETPWLRLVYQEGTTYLWQIII